jgi:peptide/nickel transport system substrate-binding protein
MESESSNHIVVAVDSDINSLDPHVFKTEAGYCAVANLYDAPLEHALQPNPDGSWLANPEIQGALVESFELASGGTELRLQIRPGATFSNGAPVTAESFSYTVERALRGPGYADLLLNLIGIFDPQQVQVVGDRAVRLKLRFSSPFLLQSLAMMDWAILDAGESRRRAGREEPWAEGWYESAALGAGPYVLDSFRPGKECVLKANRRYWRSSLPGNDGVTMKIVQSAQDRVRMLQAGEADVAVGLGAEALTQLERDTDVQVVALPSTLWKYLGVNNRTPPFDDIRVRKALCHATQYESIISQAFGGRAQPLTSPVPAGVPTHDGSFWEYGMDLDKARSLLREAGLGEGFDAKLTIREEKAEDELIADLIQQAYGEVGIRLEVEKIPSLEFHEMVAEEKLPMFILDMLSWIRDPFFKMHLLIETGALENRIGYSNARIDDIIARGLREPDPGAREALSLEAQRLFAEDVPCVLLCQPHWVVAARSTLRGIVMMNDHQLRFAYMERAS